MGMSSLFDGDAVEARSDLERFFLVRDHLPDRVLIQALRAKRGQGRRGRDDYPVAAMWHAVVAAVMFQHPSIESLRRELSRFGAVAKCLSLQSRAAGVSPFQVLTSAP